MTIPEGVAQSADFNLQLLYFTSPSLSEDGRWLVLIGERDGQPNLFAQELVTRELRQLTHNDDGVLRSYVYFDGQPFQGFGKASVSFDAARNKVYFLHGQEIRAVDLDGRLCRLGSYPEGQVTGFTHVSADGELLCVPTIDEAAFTEDENWNSPNRGIDARVRRLGLRSSMRIYATATGNEVAAEPVPEGWVTHVQFAPDDPHYLLYNHEWAADSGVRRVWLWDKHNHRMLHQEGHCRSRQDWACHEMWEREGQAVIYHGIYANGRAYIGRVRRDDGEPVEISLPEGWTRYGHFTTGPDETILVTDGYFQLPDGDDGRHCPWISHLTVDWKERSIFWRVLGRSDSSWSSQDAHPHPILDHYGRFVYFTSDKSGRRAVYRLPTDAPALVEAKIRG